MMLNHSKQAIKVMGKIAGVFIIVIASATFYLTSTTYQTSSSNSNLTTQSSTWVDDSGKLHVLGLTLGESTVRDAELILRSRADAAIFMYPLPSDNKDKKFKLVLEAYFPAIADHSKVMLQLHINDQAMEAMRLRSTSPRIYPNGVARINLSSQDILAVRHITIRALTLIPSTSLNIDLLTAQFGQAAEQSTLENGSISYRYPQIGLTANIHDSGKDTLLFQNPSLVK